MLWGCFIAQTTGTSFGVWLRFRKVWLEEAFSFAHLDPEKFDSEVFVSCSFYGSVFFFFLLVIRLYQLFCWWRCPQLILGCLVFQEVSFYSSGPSPTPTSLVIPDWNLSEPQQAGNLLLYKNTLHCFFFLLFWYFSMVEPRQRDKPASFLESFINLSNADVSKFFLAITALYLFDQFPLHGILILHESWWFCLCPFLHKFFHF